MGFWEVLGKTIQNGASHIYPAPNVDCDDFRVWKTDREGKVWTASIFRFGDKWDIQTWLPCRDVAGCAGIPEDSHELVMLDGKMPAVYVNRAAQNL